LECGLIDDARAQSSPWLQEKNEGGEQRVRCIEAEKRAHLIVLGGGGEEARRPAVVEF
jgi:hypothetical protein